MPPLSSSFGGRALHTTGIGMCLATRFVAPMGAALRPSLPPRWLPQWAVVMEHHCVACSVWMDICLYGLDY